MSTTVDTLGSISDALQSSVGSRVVYGEPVRVGDKVVVPVSKIAFGFGAGVVDHSGDLPIETLPLQLQLNGGGGGMRAYPVGALEITAKKTRFISAAPQRAWVLGLVTGAVLGVITRRARTKAALRKFA